MARMLCPSGPVGERRAIITAASTARLSDFPGRFLEFQVHCCVVGLWQWFAGIRGPNAAVPEGEPLISGLRGARGAFLSVITDWGLFSAYAASMSDFMP